MGEKTFRFFIVFLIIFIFIDLLLLIYLFKSPLTFVSVNIKKTIPFLEKDFIIDQNEFLPLNEKDIIYELGSFKDSRFGSATFRAYADKLIFYLCFC